MGDNTPKEDYRNLLIATGQKSQDSYDKTVLALSSGAMGISFAFVNDYIKPGCIVNPNLLITAWTLWALSVSSVLLSFFFSHRALKKAVKQLDEDKIHSEPPGGWYNRVTFFLNIGSGISFLAGLIFIIIFISKNLR